MDVDVARNIYLKKNRILDECFESIAQNTKKKENTKKSEQHTCISMKKSLLKSHRIHTFKCNPFQCHRIECTDVLFVDDVR